MITTRAGHLVLESLRESDQAVLGELPGPTRLLREVFTVAVRRCFTGRDPREITGYVRTLLAARGLAADGVRAREAEAVMRTVLGEPEAAAGIPDDRRITAMILVVGDLARAAAGGSEEALLAMLVDHAERRLFRYRPAPDGRPYRRSRPR